MLSLEGEKCPNCGGKRCLAVYYGYLPFDLASKVDRGEIFYGGLIVPEEEKSWYCPDCSFLW